VYSQNGKKGGRDSQTKTGTKKDEKEGGGKKRKKERTAKNQVMRLGYATGKGHRSLHYRKRKTRE